MKRRSFLAALLAAPAAAKSAVSETPAVPTRYRLSTTAEEPELAVSTRLARIDTVNAGVMRSANGLMVVDFGLGCITLT